MSWIDDLTIDDIEEDKLDFVEIIGLEAFKKLVEIMPGTNFYIPGLKDFKILHRNECIKNDFTGKNIRALAIKYELSEPTIYNIVRPIRKKKQAELVQRQIRESGQIFFDY